MTASFRQRIWDHIARELGLTTLYTSPLDAKIICLLRLLRLSANGACSLILALYLSDLGVSDTKIGLFISLTLLGNVIIAVLMTFVADGLGRRRMLAIGAVLMLASGLVFGLSSDYWVLLPAAALGIMSPSGNEVGPFRPIEESILAHLTHFDARSDIFAWYGLIGTLGLALGNVGCGFVVRRLQLGHGWEAIQSYRLIFFACAGIGLLKLILTALLSKSCEVEKRESTVFAANDVSEESPLLPNAMSSQLSEIIQISEPVFTKDSLIVLIKLCILLAVDSIGSGLVSQSWVVYFFHRKFKLEEDFLGTLFFFTCLISAFMNLVASAISKRIGLVKTMVFAHLPSTVFLALIPIPDSAALALVLLTLRYSFSSTDSAPRSAFVSAAVLPTERTRAMGIINIVKTSSQSLGPVLTGALSGARVFWIAFVVAGALKGLSDVGMLAMFWRHRTREELEESRAREGGSEPDDENHSVDRVE